MFAMRTFHTLLKTLKISLEKNSFTSCFSETLNKLILNDNMTKYLKVFKIERRFTYCKDHREL
jgi:hypothetical protein